MAQQTFSGVPGDFSSGQVLTAADMDLLREFLLYLIKDGDETDTGEVSPLILDLNDNRVGINTDSPAETLDLVTSSGAAYVKQTNGTATTYLGPDGSNTGLFGTSSNHIVRLMTNNTVRMTIAAAGAVDVIGALSKGSGSFDIAHPTKGGDWRLRHSFIEGPQADLIYRGTVTLTGGTATVDLDTVSNMTDGTWEALCRDPWSIVASSGNTVEWGLVGKTLTITGPADAACSWIVIAERQDDHMKSPEGSLADDDGYLVVEYEAAPGPPLEIEHA